MWLGGSVGAVGALVCGEVGAGEPAAVPLSTATPVLSAHDLTVPPFARGFETVRILVPPSSEKIARSRALILLHGLGETRSAALALRGWPELYGAHSADARLRHPPVLRTRSRGSYWSDEELSQVNAHLGRQPYHGAVLICPRTPNPSEARDRARLFDDYATWLFSAVLPAVEAEVTGCTKTVGLDGCSLGGYVAVEVALRKAASLASFGTVQGALGAHRVRGFAERFRAIAEDHCLPLRFATSSRDPFLDVNREMSRRLMALGVPHELDVVPGPHDQPWLREIGTLRTLRWHDVQLGAASCERVQRGAAPAAK